MVIIIEIVMQILCISIGAVIGYIVGNILWYYIEKILNKYWV